MNRLLLITILIATIQCVSKGDIRVYSKTPTEVLDLSHDSEWTLSSQKNLLYMNLKGGLVVLELAPVFAPLHSANIKKITNSKFWDGLVVMRSQDNYVAQWGDAEEKRKTYFEKNKNSLKEKIKAEFEIPFDPSKISFNLNEEDSYADNVGYFKNFPIGFDSSKIWPLHCYSMVGVSRDEDINSGNGSSLYAVTGHSPRHLDRNITVVGKVLIGMEHLSSLPRGKGRLGFYEDSRKYHPIEWARMGDKVPKKDQIKVEVLKTSSNSYRNWVEAKKARKENWFHRPAGHIDICNASPPLKIEGNL